jgi:hypothetical protein
MEIEHQGNWTATIDKERTAAKTSHGLRNNTALLVSLPLGAPCPPRVKLNSDYRSFFLSKVFGFYILYLMYQDRYFSLLLLD